MVSVVSSFVSSFVFVSVVDVAFINKFLIVCPFPSNIPLNDLYVVTIFVVVEAESLVVFVVVLVEFVANVFVSFVEAVLLVVFVAVFDVLLVEFAIVVLLVSFVPLFESSFPTVIVSSE